MGNIQLCRFLLSSTLDSFLEFYMMANPQRGGGTLDLSDGDDRMGVKLKTPKKSLGLPEPWTRVEGKNIFKNK